jgi:hypothetical protein
VTRELQRAVHSPYPVTCRGPLTARRIRILRSVWVSGVRRACMNRRWRREREQRAHTPQSMEASSGCRCSHVISSLLITVGAAARQPPPPRPRSSDSPPPRWVVARSQDRAEFTLSIWCCAAATACLLSKPCLCACLSCVTTLPPSFPAPRRAMPGSLTLRSRRTLTPPSPPHRYVHGVEERMPPEESSVTVAWCATWRGSDARMRPVRACVCRVTCMATHGLNPNKQWRRTHHRSLRRSAGTG